MLRHPGYTRERIAQVGDRIRALIHADAVAPERLAVAGPVDRIEPAEAELLDYRDCELGETFGPLWATYWFKVEATVPERGRVSASICCGSATARPRCGTAAGRSRA